MRTSKKLFITAATLALASIHILWEYFHGGVVTHYPLADSSNPGLSNWWGLLTLPTLTWIVLWLIDRRNTHSKNGNTSGDNVGFHKNCFIGALVFGLSMSLLWELGQEAVLQYVILLPWVLSFFLRIYYPEATLGFVLGMIYTFGGVLPIVFAVVIQTVGFLIYSVFFRGTKWLLKKWQTD